MKKIWIEVGISTCLVLLMIALIIVAQIALPEGLRPSGFAMIILLYILAMGLVGVRLVDLR